MNTCTSVAVVTHPAIDRMLRREVLELTHQLPQFVSKRTDDDTQPSCTAVVLPGWQEATRPCTHHLSWGVLLLFLQLLLLLRPLIAWCVCVHTTQNSVVTS